MLGEAHTPAHGTFKFMIWMGLRVSICMRNVCLCEVSQYS